MYLNPGDPIIHDLLKRSTTIAVVGLSPKPHRDSNRVSLYMQRKGYRIIPVYPRGEEILGEKVYRQLADIPVPVDIVNVFRRADAVVPIVKSALVIRPAAVWLQLGIENEEAARMAAAGNILMIMNRCIMVDHQRLGL